MKIAVFSDSHGFSQPMREIIENVAPDAIIHLGDGVREALAIRRARPDTPVFFVRGNCDLFPAGETVGLVELGGRVFFLAHGHTFSVKSGLGRIIEAAVSAGAELLLFGHTHVPYYKYERGIYVMNPGSVRDGYYGLIELSGEGVRCMKCRKRM